MSIENSSIATGESENNITDDVVPGNNNKDNDDSNNVDNDANDDTSDDDSSGAASGSDDVSTSSAVTPEDSEPAAPWVSIVALVNDNVENGIDSNITSSSPNNQFELQSDYDLDAKEVYDNDDSVDAFLCIAYTGGSEDKHSNDNDFQEHSGGLG